MEKSLTSSIRHDRRKSENTAIPLHFVKHNLIAELFLNKVNITHLIQRGLSYKHFMIIQKYTPLSEQDWCKVLNLSSRTLSRYKDNNKKFGPLHSEKIFEIAEVTVEGLRVFQDADKFKLWLNTLNFALGNKKPIDLIKDSYGKDLVMAELVRIDEGIFV